MKPLVITACGRSGTAYVSVVLSAAGYWCGHEHVYGVHGAMKLKGSTIEASSLAPAHLDLLDASGAVVFHQVRHPLRVAASAVARGSFEVPSKAARIALDAMPQIASESTPLERALRYWIGWNRRIASVARGWWQLEMMDAGDLAEALEASGRVADRRMLERSLHLVPSSINAQPSPPERLGWVDVPQGPTRDEAMDMATSFGYLDARAA